MILMNLNIEIHTDNEREIEELKGKGFKEVKDVRHTKSKNTGKTKKSDPK